MPSIQHHKTPEMVHGAVNLLQWIHRIIFFFCTRQHVPAPMFAHYILSISARIKFLFIPGSGTKCPVVNKILHNLWDGHHCYKVSEVTDLSQFQLKRKKNVPFMY